jgi:riboflavin synthase
MFTGIIEEAGFVQKVQPTPQSIQLTVKCGPLARGLKRGDSVAVNGCCLTAVDLKRSGRGTHIRFDLLHETWSVTNLQFAKVGSLVNLERPLRADGRLDGHFVTGHVDGLGRIRRWERVGQDHCLEIAAAPAIMNYIVPKGSIAVDGISLTIAAVFKGRFRIWIIPHTFEVTALGERTVGDAVNLEADILGKYVARFIESGKLRLSRGN